MATITIENVPDNVVKTFGQKISYKDINSKFLPKKRRNLTENGFTLRFEEELLKDEKDPENISYGPFSNVDSFLAHLKSNNNDN